MNERSAILLKCGLSASFRSLAIGRASLPMLALIALLPLGCIQPKIALDDFGTGGQSVVTGAGDAGFGDQTGSKPDPDPTMDDSMGTDDTGSSAPTQTGGKVPDASVKTTTTPSTTKPVSADASTKPIAADAGATPPVADDAGSMTTANGPVPTKLSFTVKTAPMGGRYSPRNIYAIWVVDGKGTFVKTLAKYAFIRAIFLSGWYGASGGDTTDAVTGATMNSHGQRSVTWNFTDQAGKTVPDGDYKLVVELTEADSTGVSTTIPFTKGPAPVKLMPPDQKSFLSMSLVLE